MRPFFHIRAIALPALFVFLALLPGCASNPDTVWRMPRWVPRVSESTPRTDYNRTTFDYAWKMTDRYFYDASFNGHDWPALREKYRPAAEAATDDEALYKTINEMLAQLGTSHITAIEPDIVRLQKKVRSESVSLIGFISVKLPGIDTPVVYEVDPASPAAEAGIKRGWLQIGEMIRLEPDAPIREGETVQLNFHDEHDTPRVIPITLRAMPGQGARKIARLRPDGILHMRFDRFDTDAASWVRAQIKLHASQTRGIVLDLRLNGGGKVRVCRRILGEFFSTPVKAGSFIDRRGKPVVMEANITHGSARYAGPLVVLVARASGSASEVFAAAVQDAKRGVIVGSTSTGRTAGAVLMSMNLTLPGGGRLQVPVRDYVTASGAHLEGGGVLADVQAPLPTVASLRANEDAALEQAVAVAIGSK